MVYRVPVQPESGFKWSARDRRISFQFAAIEIVPRPAGRKEGLHHMSHLCWRSVHGFSMLSHAFLRVHAIGLVNDGTC